MIAILKNSATLVIALAMIGIYWSCATRTARPVDTKVGPKIDEFRIAGLECRAESREGHCIALIPGKSGAFFLKTIVAQAKDVRPHEVGFGAGRGRYATDLPMGFVPAGYPFLLDAECLMEIPFPGILERWRRSMNSADSVVTIMIKITGDFVVAPRWPVMPNDKSEEIPFSVTVSFRLDVEEQ